MTPQETFGAARVLSRHATHSPEWYACRKTSIGASEMAAVLGLGDPRYSTPAGVFLAKTEERSAFDGNAMTEVGAAIEAAILLRAIEGDYFEFTYATARGILVGQLGHLDHDTITCNLDGYLLAAAKGTVDGVIVPIEAKRSADHQGHATRQWDDLEAWLDGSGDFASWHRTAIEGYWVQVQTQMAILGSPYGYLAGCIGAEASTRLCLGLSLDDKQYRVLKIPRDHAFIDKMIPRAVAWWEKHVVAGVCPPTSEHDLDALKKTRAIADAGSTVSRGDLRGLARKFEHVKVQIKGLEKRKNAMEARLRAEIGSAETVELGGGRVLTAKTTHRKAYTRDVKAGESRTIRVKKLKKGRKG